MSDTLLRKVNIYKNIYRNGASVRVKTKQGYFHCWGTDYDEFDNGQATTFTVGIVELEDGQVITRSPKWIEFINEDEE